MLNDEASFGRPFFRCAVCHEPIDDAHAANLVWCDGDEQHPLIAHKEGCDLQLRRSGYICWIPLGAALLCLINNSHLSIPKARREATIVP